MAAVHVKLSTRVFRRRTLRTNTRASTKSNLPHSGKKAVSNARHQHWNQHMNVNGRFQHLTR